MKKTNTKNNVTQFHCEIGFDPSVHGIHLEPCYRKFPKIISIARKRNADEAESTRIKRKKSEECLNTCTVGPGSRTFPKDMCVL